MAILKRTKAKAPSAPANGSTAGEKSNGEPWAWELTATALNNLFLKLATVVSAPDLKNLEKVLAATPDPDDPDITPADLKKVVKPLVKRGKVYIQDARQYLNETENELKTVIRLLSKAIAEMSSDENKFAKSILETTNRLSDICILEDLRAIRESISNEVGSIQDAVREQKENRTTRMSQLIKRVDVLQDELETVSQESLRDPLTGLYNRRAFDQELKGLVDRNRILPNAFLLVIFDIDDFKLINDRLGHPIGDKALQLVAKSTRDNLRSSDFLARYGGDEFVLLLQTDSLKKGKKRIQGLADSISQLAIPVEYESKTVQLALTLILGIARFQEGDTEQTLLSRADEILYLSKKAGKNRVSTEEDLT